MIRIDELRCIGCGMCVTDCPTGNIKLEGKKAVPLDDYCNECGHCAAICPQNCVAVLGYDMSEVVEYNKETFSIAPQRLLNFIRFRRTMRQFLPKEVEEEKLLQVIEAGRYTETGSNSQNVSYILVRDKIDQLRKIALESLNELGKYRLAHPEEMTPLLLRYGRRWIEMYEAYQKNPQGEDTLFFNAKNLILVVSPSPINGGLASANMELMVNALGLGMVFSGFFVAAAQTQKVRDFLELDKEEAVITCMIVGYPKVSYRRTAPRKKPVIRRM